MSLPLKQEQQRYMQLRAGMHEEPVESSDVKIKEKTCKSNTLVGVCCRLPNQEEKADEASYEQMGAF